jgi:chromosome segregation ATPase
VTLRRSGGVRPGVEEYSFLRNRLDRHLDDVEQVVESLREELGVCREQVRVLAEERDQLRQQVMRADLVARDLAEFEARLRETERDCQREVKLRENLELERRDLVARAASLEQTLVRERAQQADHRREIACLEEQVRELKAILGLVAGERTSDES